MDGMTFFLVIGLGVPVVLTATVIVLYNGLVNRRNAWQGAWSQIDVQLKRRCDLIPNLVETVKGYAAHEKETLDRVITARGAAVAARDMPERVAAEGVLSAALGRLLAVVEQYPNLKANENFMLLQEELTSTENRIAFARQAYNDAVQTYNTARETFPTNVVAGAFAFAPAVYFAADEGAKATPAVRF